MMSGWFAVVFGTLLAWFTLAGSADGQPVNCTEPAQAVRTIWANFYINAVREINSPSSTFYADIYVNYEWFDPELSSGNSAFQIAPPPRIQPLNLSMDAISNRCLSTIYPPGPTGMPISVWKPGTPELSLQISASHVFPLTPRCCRLYLNRRSILAVSL